LLATLVHLRHGVTHDVLACWFGVSRSTITRAIGEVRPLLAERGCTVEGGIRLRTLADVVAHLGATRQLGLLDATEVWVRRPAAHKAGRARFVSGKARANTVKALVITDPAGRLLCCGQTRPGAIHDLTQVRQASLVELLALTSGYPARRRWLPGPEHPDRRRGAHPAAGPAEEPDPDLSRRRRGTRGRTPGPRVKANPRQARHQPPEELASPVPSPRPTRTPRHHPARRRRPGLQPGTSPTTCSASPPTESSPGRHRRVIELALSRSTTARG
jgi:hypothetical protein